MSKAGPEFDAELQANLRRVKVPTQGQKIYKDECIYSFDTPVGHKMLKIPYYFQSLLLSFVSGNYEWPVHLPEHLPWRWRVKPTEAV